MELFISYNLLWIFFLTQLFAYLSVLQLQNFRSPFASVDGKGGWQCPNRDCSFRGWTKIPCSTCSWGFNGLGCSHWLPWHLLLHGCVLSIPLEFAFISQFYSKITTNHYKFLFIYLPCHRPCHWPRHRPSTLVDLSKLGYSIVKFMFSKKATKMMKSSLWIWRYVVNVNSMVKISSIFVAFLENMNFNH